MTPALKFGSVIVSDQMCHFQLYDIAVIRGLTNIVKGRYTKLADCEGFMHEGVYYTREAALDMVIKLDNLREDQINHIVDSNGGHGLESMAYEEVCNGVV